MHFLFKKLPFWVLFFCAASARSQEILPLTDLSFWKTDGTQNWQIAADATVDLSRHDQMSIVKGSGVLANLPGAKNRANLLSVKEYGDVDVSFDFMMAVHSNSGFYLQGRYEVQLMDSWGVQKPTFADCGGIFARRRWNPGEQLFDGVPPRLNASLAPGLWQHIEISFQAPRFDASGKKTSNARLLKVVLNGALIHENLELTGPTGGPISEQEAKTGPFLIQGDHGPVAFRNFSIFSKQNAPVQAEPFSYRVIHGSYRNAADFAGKKSDLEGITEKLSWEVAQKEDGFATIFNGNLIVPEAGKHQINLHIAGRSSMRVNGLEVLPDEWTTSDNPRMAQVELPAGKVPVEIVNYKMEPWLLPYLGLWVEGPGSRPAALHALSSTLSVPASDPIMLDAQRPTVFRSFMDIDLKNYPQSPEYNDQPNFFRETKRKRIVHAVQVGDPSQVHYTYDLDNGAVAQIWKGDFLNTSPMWDNRGDGSSRPLGAVLSFDDVSVVVAKADLFDLKPSITEPVAEYRPKGYDLDDGGQPTFRYQHFGMDVSDQLRVSAGKMLTRTLTFDNIPAGQTYVCRLVTGEKIEKSAEDTWVVDGKKYYIQLPKGAKVSIEQSGNLTVLYVPVTQQVSYSILW